LPNVRETLLQKFYLNTQSHLKRNGTHHQVKVKLGIKVLGYNKNSIKQSNQIQWNSVITNSSGPAKSVRYNRVDLCSKWTFGSEIFVGYNRVSDRYNQMFVLTEFVITEFIITRVSMYFSLKWSMPTQINPVHKEQI